MRLKDIKWAVMAIAVILLDQIVKFIVCRDLSSTDSITVIPRVLNFVNVQNTGAAFSMFSEKTAILSVVSIVFCIAVLVLWFYKKEKHFLLKLSLMLLFSGALANALDRIFRHYVVDFIETEFIKFPVFNIADIAITFGTVFLMIYLIFFDKDKPDEKRENEEQE